MGANLAHMKAGEEVVIGIKDMDVIQQMQSEHGGWNEGMKECLVGPCKLIQGIGSDAVIKGPSGNVYRINSELLTKYKKEKDFRSGTIVKIIDNENVMQELQKGHGGMSDGMKGMLGQRVEIVQVFEDGDYKVKYKDKSYTINPKCIDNATETEPQSDKTQIKEGKTVKIITDVGKMKTLQENHGGWTDLMAMFLGQEVEIVKVFDDGDCYVSKFGMEWLINPLCIESEMRKTDKKDGKLRKGDTVKISEDIKLSKELQTLHGGWISAMKLFAGKVATVESIMPTGDVKVSVNGMSFVYNRLLLTKIEGKCVSSASFSPGDSVRVIKDIEKVKRLQAGHGEWVDSMRLLLGEKGKVKHLFPDGDLRVKILGNKVTLNPECVEKLERDNDSVAGAPSSRTSSKSFKPGDKVKLSNDKEKVKRLQAGHGEWVDSMKLLLGEKGKVKHLFPDGDLRVKIMGNQVTLNPECVEKVDSDSDSEPDIMKLMQQMHKIFAADSDNSNNSDSDSDAVLKEDTSQTKQFFKALNVGNLSQVRSLVDVVGPDVSEKGKIPLVIAADEGHLDIVRLLLDKKANVSLKDGDGNTALHAAIKKNRLDICKMLIEKGADINAQNNKKITPIMVAAEVGCKDVLRICLERRDAEINLGDAENDTALHLAVQKSQEESVEILLTYKADSKALNNKQFTPFHLAALRGHEKILELFLKKEGGTLVDLQKDDKFTALHLAAINNHSRCMVLLLKYNADINIRNSKLQTPLHIAVSQKYLECVKILVENNAELNLKDDSGDTPLHDAIRIHNMDRMKGLSSLLGIGDMMKMMGAMQKGSDKPEDIVLYLVSKGAKLDIKNNAGKTPLSSCQDDDLKTKLLTKMTQKETKLLPNENRPAVSMAIPAPMDPVGAQHATEESGNKKTRDEEVEELRRIIKEMEDKKTCIICYDRPINVTFGCGHMSCDVCANNLYECHMCRANIDQKIRIYE